MSGDDAVQHNQGAGEGQATPVSPAGHGEGDPSPVSLGHSEQGQAPTSGWELQALANAYLSHPDRGVRILAMALSGNSSETLTKMAPSHGRSKP
jgi:hypothetical protein